MYRQPPNVGLVKDALAKGVIERAIAFPIEVVVVHHHAFGKVLGAMAGGIGEIWVAMMGMGGALFQALEDRLLGEGLRVRVEQVFVNVEPKTLEGPEGTVDPVQVEGPGGKPPDELLPIV